MLGTIVNAAAILVGALLGVFLRKGIPQRYKDVIMQGVGLAVALIGAKMALQTQNELLVIISLVLGGLLGEAIDLDKLLQKLGSKLSDLVKTSEHGFVKGFVSSSLVYCVGAMAIMGSLQSGLTGEHKILFAKATLDGISSIIFASSMGIGVAFSSLAVFVYQGAITLLAGSVKPLMTESVLMEMTATGGLLIIAIASNILEIKEFKVANLLPALFVVIIITRLVTVYYPSFY